MGLSRFFRNPFRSFGSVVSADMTTEAGRIRAASADPDRPGARHLTNMEVTAITGVLPKVRTIVVGAEKQVGALEARFNTHRDGAAEAWREHQACGERREIVPTHGRKAHRADATVVGGDAVIAGRAGAAADELRKQAQAETGDGAVDHLIGLSSILMRIGLVVLGIDMASLLFFFFRWLNVALNARAFKDGFVLPVARVVSAVGFASILALFMFLCSRQAGRLSWALRNAAEPDRDQADPRLRRKLRWVRAKAGVLWAFIILVPPVAGFGVAQRLLNDGQGAGIGSAGTALAIGLALVFATAPVAIALSESFAASRTMQRVAALGAIAARLDRDRNVLAQRATAQDHAADQVERQARSVVATAYREARHARLAAEQLIWATRGRLGHMGDVASAIELTTAGEGELLPDISLEGAFTPLQEILDRMAARPGGRPAEPAASDHRTAPDAGPGVHLTKVDDGSDDERAA